MKPCTRQIAIRYSCYHSAELQRKAQYVSPLRLAPRRPLLDRARLRDTADRGDVRSAEKVGELLDDILNRQRHRVRMGIEVCPDGTAVRLRRRFAHSVHCRSATEP